MNRPPREPIERRLERAGRTFPYPATPALATLLREPPRRRRGFTLPPRPLLATLAALVIVAALLLAVPGVRAAVRSWLFGVVEVIPNAPTASPAPALGTATPTPSATSGPGSTATPGSTEPSALRRLVGATSLEEARRRFRLPVLLPAYPADLGPPDRVYLQNLDGSAVILAWLDPADPSRVRLSLHMLTSPAVGFKTNVSPESASETTVAGRPALWIDAPHLLEVYDSRGRRDIALRQLVQGNVLLWEQDGVTYRLETELPLEEAIRVAESLER